MFRNINVYEYSLILKFNKFGQFIDSQNNYQNTQARR